MTKKPTENDHDAPIVQPVAEIPRPLSTHKFKVDGEVVTVERLAKPGPNGDWVDLLMQDEDAELIEAEYMH